MGTQENLSVAIEPEAIEPLAFVRIEQRLEPRGDTCRLHRGLGIGKPNMDIALAQMLALRWRRHFAPATYPAGPWRANVPVGGLPIVSRPRRARRFHRLPWRGLAQTRWRCRPNLVTFSLERVAFERNRSAAPLKCVNLL
jgi:hypothetical protein